MGGRVSWSPLDRIFTFGFSSPPPPPPPARAQLGVSEALFKVWATNPQVIVPEVSEVFPLLCGPF
eukprot:COSAG01_NODE_13072_length_1640_cov_148.027255_3_plen_65_part_00